MKFLENYLKDKCLKCNICCRFPERYSPLIPYFLDKEIRDKEYFSCIGNFYGCRIDVVKFHDGYSCPYFNEKQNNCSIYSSRPLDCRLYPFMIAYGEDFQKIVLVLDRNCPYSGDIKKFQKGVLEFADNVKLGLRNIGFINDPQGDTIVVGELPKLSEFKMPKGRKSVRNYLWRDILNVDYPIKGDADYIYLREELVKLMGNKYKDKRNLCNYFENNYGYKTQKISASGDEIADCIRLYKQWAMNKIKKNSDLYFRQLIEDSFFFHRRAFLDFHTLGLEGILVKVGDRLAGYTFGCKIDEKTFCILAEITDKIYKGINQFIFREFCRIIPENYLYINTMDDSGIEGLKINKISYYPIR